MMIDFTPGETVQNIVKQLKSYTVFHIWDRYPELEHQFWKKKMFWSDGYFACSVGDASRETIQRYIETQGGRPQLIHPRC
jgi:putative transposase